MVTNINIIFARKKESKIEVKLYVKSDAERIVFILLS